MQTFTRTLRQVNRLQSRHNYHNKYKCSCENRRHRHIHHLLPTTASRSTNATVSKTSRQQQLLALHKGNRKSSFHTSRPTCSDGGTSMGSMFGKETVEEPKFQVLLSNDHNNVASLPYEIRKYGNRFAVEVPYGTKADTGSPFMQLAKYIGVFGAPENEGTESIAMTAPVVMTAPTKIAMTAPVVTTNDRMMKFILPSSFDSMSKIPKPTNPDVRISEIPEQYGAVHRFNGAISESTNEQVARSLAKQLMSDGVDGITEEHVMEHFQFWGYNPPFTIPYFRRNEVWVELAKPQVDHLLNKFKSEAEN